MIISYITIYYKIIMLVLSLLMLLIHDLLPHETEGRYLVNQINAERNRNQDSEYYFFEDLYHIYRYSFSKDKREIYMQFDKDEGYYIYDYAGRLCAA